MRIAATCFLQCFAGVRPVVRPRSGQCVLVKNRCPHVSCMGLHCTALQLHNIQSLQQPRSHRKPCMTWVYCCFPARRWSVCCMLVCPSSSSRTMPQGLPVTSPSTDQSARSRLTCRSTAHDYPLVLCTDACYAALMLHMVPDNAIAAVVYHVSSCMCTGAAVDSQRPRRQQA